MKHLIRTSTLLAVLTALLTLGLVAPGSAATTTGVKGVVTLDGKPVKGLTVELHLTGDDGYESAVLDTDTTNSKGAYSFRISTKGPEYMGHTIIVRDPSYRVIATSRAFRGRAGKTVTRNVGVKAAGSITGTLKRGDGRASSLLRVDVFGPYVLVDRFHESEDSLAYDRTVRVATDGSFALRGLPPGDYDLGFVDDYRTYFAQCYDQVAASGKECGEAGSGSTTIKLSAGQHVTVKPQVLTTKGVRISGTVTDTSGRAIEGVTVAAQTAGGKTLADDDSSRTGAFRVGPLTEGQYRLLAAARYPWASQIGSTFGLTGGDLSGVAIRLKSRAKVEATLTPREGAVKVAVDVSRAATGSSPSGTVTISWGTRVKHITLVKGKGTAKLSGLPEGRRQITVSYGGTTSTAAITKVYYATVT